MRTRTNFLETVHNQKEKIDSLLPHCISIPECYLENFELVPGGPCSSSVQLAFSHSKVNISLLTLSVPRYIVIVSPFTPLLRGR